MSRRGHLNDAFWRLRRRYRWGRFSTKDAAAFLSLSSGGAALTLSRLVRAGLLVRVERSRYIALDASWAWAAAGGFPLDRFRAEPFFPVLVGALSGASDILGGRLRGVALFGSCSRHDYGPESDIDLLLIEDPANRIVARRLLELAPVERDCWTLARERQARGAGLHLPQFVPLTPEELRLEPPVLLDMTEDGVILYDPESLISGAFARLRGKLNRRRAQRVAPSDAPHYWVLDATARIGEVGEL